jgi:hypothetical protein
MAFEVQSPTAPTTTANAYIAVQTFKDYHDDRGNVYTASDTEIEDAIVRATDYIDARWTFAGYRNDLDQSTECPRSGVLDERTGYWVDEYPPELEEACAEYAMSALAGSLYPSPNVDATGRAVKKTRNKAAVLEKETEYFNASQAQTWTAYPLGDAKMVRTKLLMSRRRTLGRG